MVGFSQRTQKQCKWRYENVVAPREEGKLLFDPPASASDPTSPSSGKKKKTKTFIKIAPPSPSKAARNVKVSQLLSQDNNAQYRNIFCAKFDTIKSIANKRAPTTKPITVNPQMKSSKHAQVFAEHGINYDSPLPATMIAQARYDRIQMERKKLEAQRQQAAVAAAAAASGTPIAPTGLAGVPATIVSSGPVVAAAAMATTNVNVNLPQNVPPKPRGQFTSITIPGTMPPIVLQGSPNPNELITRDAHVSISNMLAQQRRPEFTAQQQQQLIQLQQKQAIAQVQTMANQQQTIQQQNTGSPSPTPNVTILNAGSIGTTQSPQIVRQAAPVQVHPSSQPQTQTVVLASGLAQALAASVGSPITVSSSAISTTTTQLTSTVNTTNTLLPTIPRHLQPTSLSTQPQLQRVPTLTMQDIVSSANTQRIQAGIITTSASGLQSVGQPPQPTLVSLTPMMGTNNPQLTTKIIQNPQGIATLVQSSPRAGAPQITQQASKQLTPLQLQYLRQSGLIRQANPVSSSPVSQQQQVQAIKDQLVGGPQQIKRIQVVAAGPPPTIVTSSSMSSHPQATVSLPSISTIQSGSSYSAVPVIPSTSSPVVTLSGTASKQATMGQPPVSMASMAISSSVSAATASAVLSQQSQQRQVQLVKQHTVGGKTVTRPVTDAEVAAFLKHHGIPAITSAQGPLGGSKNPVATATFPNVQGQPTLLTVGLQNIMKVQSTASGQLATLVKSTGGPPGQQNPGGPMAFPVHVSKINTKGGSPGGPGGPKQQPVQTLGVQQVMIQRRQPDVGPPQTVQQQQHNAQQAMVAASQASAAQGKITHITTQVTPQGNIPTHVVVQTTQKQLPNTLAVQQLQQVFKQVGATSQVINQSGQVLQAQMIAKPLGVNPNSITVTTSGATSSGPLQLTPSSTSTASLVHIPSMVQGAGSSPIHARIVPVSVNVTQQPGGVKQTIQVVSGHPPPNATIIGTGQMSVRPPVVSASTVQQVVNNFPLKLPPTSTSGSGNNPNEDN